MSAAGARVTMSRHWASSAGPALRLGLPQHLVEMHPGSVEVEVEMEIDVEVESLRDREDAGDLPVRIGVGVRAAADEVGARRAGVDQKLLGAGIVDEALL